MTASMRRPWIGKRARSARVTSGCPAEWAGTAVAVATIVLAVVRMGAKLRRGAISHKADDHGHPHRSRLDRVAAKVWRLMSTQDELVKAGQKLLLNNYRQAPVVMSRGEGCTLWDADGRRYLDMTAGVAVCVLGHSHAGLADAIGAQARQLVHASNLYYLEAQVRLAEALQRRAFKGRIFFCNSGTEANEAALKLARRYQVVTQSRPHRTELVAFENSFHGRTMGALSVTGQPKYRNGFGPLVEPVRFLPFGDIAAARAAITDKTCAVILEPIQAEGGILLPPPGYLQDLRRLCTDTGTVLIFDEVQTGTGRTGTFYAFENEGRRPRRGHAGQGAGGRRADRRDARQRRDRTRVRAGHARVDLRRQSAGDRGGAVRAARDRLREPARALPRRRLRTSARRCCGWPSGGGRRRAARAAAACCRV